jgi:membrane protease YdiL (CAAX protease family)
MKNQYFWKAKASFILYLLLIAGIIVGNLLFVILMFGIGIDIYKVTFPTALVSLPINEGLIIAITLLYVKKNSINLKKLGLKKPKLKTIIFASFLAIILFLSAIGLSIIEEIILGPNPESEFLLNSILPQNILQLIALIGISITLVGPAEELAFRGFIQRGFETSYGKNIGLFITSMLFGLLHGINSWRSIIPVTVVSVFVGYVWQKTDGNTTIVAWVHGMYDALIITTGYFTFA